MNQSFLLLGTSIFVASALGQSYSIPWSSVDGGGGTSTGGLYSVSGTIGQPDAGAMSGGNYSLDGGFWGIVGTLETPGAPRLTLRFTKTNTIVVSWPVPATGFSLQQASTVTQLTWTTPLERITDNGTNAFIIVNPPAGNRFYRLFKP